MGVSQDNSRRTRRSSEIVTHTVSTRVLRVPYRDWVALWTGKKHEFRAPHKGAIASCWEVPTLVVLSATPATQEANCISVVTHHAVQHLRDISEDDEGLEREGFESYDAFREYWRERTNAPYRPMQKVEVFRIEPFTNARREACASTLLHTLYGSYLDP